MANAVKLRRMLGVSPYTSCDHEMYFVLCARHRPTRSHACAGVKSETMDPMAGNCCMCKSCVNVTVSGDIACEDNVGISMSCRNLSRAKQLEKACSVGM
eukprot:1940638-Amphidinium_carterae.1